MSTEVGHAGAAMFKQQAEQPTGGMCAGGAFACLAGLSALGPRVSRSTGELEADHPSVLLAQMLGLDATSGSLGIACNLTLLA